MKLTRDTISNWTKFPVIALTLVLALGIGLAGCSDDDNDGGVGPGGDTDALQTLQDQDDLTLFSQYITDTGLEEQLSSGGPYTIFAPTNNAFDNLPEGYAENLSQDQLEEIINYHVTSLEIPSGDINQEQSVQTLQEDSVFIVPGADGLVVNRHATVTEADIEASNAFIHKIDNLLLPDSYLTVFGIADKRYYTSLFACNCTSGRTGLQPVLEDSSLEFTVFVSTNAAFEEINDEELSDEELREIMEYHVVEEVFLSGALTDGQILTTRNGAELTVNVEGDGTISLNNGTAVVLTTDLAGVNGVVHIIDTVLTPPSHDDEM